MPHAGTDANVTLQLYGDKGQTEKIMLRQEKGKTLKRFDRGRTDRFTVQTMDVGTVINAKTLGKQGSTEGLPKLEVHPCGFWEIILIEFSFAFLARNLGSKTRLFP